MLILLLTAFALANDVPSVDELGKGKTPEGWALPWKNGEAPRVRRHPDPPYPVLAKEMGLSELNCSFRVTIDTYGEPKGLEFFDCLPIARHEVEQTVLSKWRWYPAQSAARKPVTSWMDVDLRVASKKVYGAVREEDVADWLGTVGHLDAPDDHCEVELTLTPTRGRFRVATNDVPECLVLTQKRAAWGDIPEKAECEIRFKVGGSLGPGGVDWGACPKDVQRHLGRTLSRWQWMKPRDREPLYVVKVRYTDEL